MPEDPNQFRLSSADYLRTDTFFVMLWAGLVVFPTALLIAIWLTPSPPPPTYLPWLIVLSPFGALGLAAVDLRWRLARIRNAIAQGKVLLTTAQLVAPNPMTVTIMPKADSFWDKLPCVHFLNRRLKGLKTGDPIAVVWPVSKVLPQKVVLEALLDPEELRVIRERVASSSDR